MFLKRNWVYDIEVFQNFFCVVFISKDDVVTFEISSRKNELDGLYDFVTGGRVNYFIGFNCVRYDMQVVQLIIDWYDELSDKTAEEINEQIYAWSKEIIALGNARERLPYMEYQFCVKNIDLFLINHYNNVSKMTSLKWLEYSMNWYKVQDLPLKWDKPVPENMFDDLISYCVNDVRATQHVGYLDKKLITLRLNQNREHERLNLLNKSDSSVGETMMLHYMSKALGVNKKDLRKQQSFYKKIRFSDVIFDYVSFKQDVFKGVLNKLSDCVVGTHDNLKFKTVVKFKGIEYVFGEGGLHASQSNKIFESDEDYGILDVDVKSYYPNLSIRNNLYPKHLSEVFCKVLLDIYNERLKTPKSDPKNASLKLTMNSVYGKSKSIYSFLYDKKFQLGITLNGQLLLAMLCEQFAEIEGLTILQANTDGITVKYPLASLSQIYDICGKWEELTDLTLEYANYTKMVIRDVNNYLAVYDDGKVKLKGCFEIDRQRHKNRSQRIVPIALSRYFVDGVEIEDTIRNHLQVNEGYGEYEKDGKKKYKIESQGIYDFCLGQKIRSNQRYSIVALDTTETLLTDKVIRYYISKNGQRLKKTYASGTSAGKHQAVHSGYNVSMFMEYEKRDDYDIDYRYYIKEVEKITTALVGGNNTVGFQGTLF